MENLKQLNLEECMNTEGGAFFTSSFRGLQEEAIEGWATFAYGLIEGTINAWLQ